jgi:lipopolysaccharide transport system ATP-binding protein
MSDVAIALEDVSKLYLLSHRRAGGDGLRHVIQAMLAAPYRMLQGRSHAHTKDTAEEFWALRDVSFEVRRGEVMGIVGRNGAGKSTLLKILSRITEPTNGRVTIDGRVASLLEVGTGFHPELSGRENIFLNGSILGMSRAEIRARFDEIVAFAEIEKFLDTPVKRYSSGMYVRLAFAVAAHLDSEILIVDEVLAVGDAQFQKKCMGKMHDVTTGGRTVLFVSHNLDAVRTLCTRAVVLRSGTVQFCGDVQPAIDHYFSDLFSGGPRQKRAGTGFDYVTIVDEAGKPLSTLTPGQTAFIELRLKVDASSDVRAGCTIFNDANIPLVLCAAEFGSVTLRVGMQTFRIRLPLEFLQQGQYRIEGAMWDQSQVYDHDDALCRFQILPDQPNEILGRSSSALFALREAWQAVE